MKKLHIIVAFLFFTSYLLLAQAPSNRGLYFNGGTHVTIPSLAALGGAISFTIEAWIKVQAPLNPGDKRNIILKHDNSTGYQFGIENNSGNIRLFCFINNTQFSSSPISSFQINAWYHVALVKSLLPSPEILFYLNGSLLNSVSTSLNVTAALSSGYIGAGNSSNGTTPFIGQIDEVRLFTTSARTAVQISADMNSTNNEGAEAFWSFESISGQNVSNNGTVSSSYQGTLGNSSSTEPSDPLWAIRVKNLSDSGPESFRQVLTELPTGGETTYVDFSIPPPHSWIINLSSPLPPIVSGTGVIIDGTSQLGWQANGDKITINGGGTLANALDITVSNEKVSIWGLRFTNFVPGTGQATLKIDFPAPGSGEIEIGNLNKGNVWSNCNKDILVDGINTITQPTVKIIGNKFGTDDSGNILQIANNGQYSIDIKRGNSNQILHNIIVKGINIENSNNLVRYNKIGTLSTGNEILPISNQIGVRLGASNIVRDNIIGNFQQVGIQIAGNNNHVYDNNIGVGADGTSNIKNGAGIDVHPTSVGNLIVQNKIANSQGTGLQTGVIIQPGGRAVVTRNEIFCNANIGISNGAKAAPTITGYSGGNLTGGGVIAGDTVHIYKDNTTCSVTAKQGRQYLGFVYVSSGTTWSFATTLINNGDIITATATSNTGQTSPFSTPFVYSIYFYTLGNNAVWNVNSNLWSNDGTNPCNCSPNGIAGANVYIRHNATIPTGSIVTSSTIIDIQNPVTLTSDIPFTAQQLEGVSGAKLLMNINNLPTITNNQFATTPGTIVEFAGGSGSIPNQFGTANYRNLIISGTTGHVKTISDNTTIQENLTINGGTLATASHNLIVLGTTTIASGAALTDAANGGINEFREIINNGSFDASGVSNGSTYKFLGNITNNNNFSLDCNCPIVFEGVSIIEVNSNAPSAMIFGASGATAPVNFNTNVRFLGSSPIIFRTNNNLTIQNNVTVFNSLNNGSTSRLTIYGHLNGVSATSTWQQGNNSYLEYLNTNKPMATGQLLASTPSNTVRYENNTTTPTDIKETTYYDLMLVGTSIKRFSPNTIVENLLDGTFANTLDLQGNTLQIRGDWIGSFSGILQANNGRVIFNGNSLQTISNRTAFDILEIANPAHVGISGADNSANRLTLTQGRLQLGNSTFTLTANPATDQITQTFTNTSTSYVETNGTGNLTRQNLLANTPYVFPIGDASAIRHLTVTLPNTTPFVRAIFVPSVTPTPPPVNTDIAAGRWLLQGANGATVSFHNSGAVGFLSKVHRLDVTNWTDAGITTTFNAGTGTYTATPLNFSSGETYTIFGQNVNHTVVISSFTQTPQPDGSILLSAFTNYNLPTQFISTNMNVAQIVNGNRLIVTYNNADEFTDILAFNPGQNPIPASDTVQVMRIYNWGYINQLSQDLDRKILLYPNPTNDEVFFTLLDNRLKVEKINLYNVWGQKLSVPISFDSGKISLQTLPEGVYVAEIILPEGVIRKKITKR